MRTYRCKCGESEAFGTMNPSDCASCEVCGTRLLDSVYVFNKADIPEDQWLPKPHTWKIRYDTNTGKSYEICRECLLKKKDDK